MTITTRIVQVDTMGTSLCSRTDSGSVDLAYTAYGHDSGALTDGPLMRFNGQLRESMCGHYLLGNGYRAYNSILMRFNSPDSLSPFGGGELMLMPIVRVIQFARVIQRGMCA